MTNYENYDREKLTAETRTKLSALNVESLSEIEAELVPGWRFQFIPSSGPLAGKRIERTFIVANGEYFRCVAMLRRRYGSNSQIFAGRSLWNDDLFGDWDD